MLYVLLVIDSGIFDILCRACGRYGWELLEMYG